MRKEFSTKTKALAFQRSNGRCAVDDCLRPQRCESSCGWLCHMHYQRWAKYGSTSLPNRKSSPDGVCLADGCASPVRSGNAAYCETHYYRLRRSSSLALKPIEGGACKHCGKTLSRKKRSFCSIQCTYRYANKTPNERHCADCGKLYSVNGRSICCSKACRQARADRLLTEARKRFAATPEGKEFFRQREYIRKARKQAVGSELFSRTEIFARDGWRCGLCGRKVSKKAKWPHPSFATLDHIIPLSRGGPHTRQNVQTAHLRCNTSKNSREIGQLRIFG